ncbi:isopentenyl-diphosphate Delta-isomerase [Klebsiella pneumoniae]|uniref:isopentenyl-diphosphate Delta-isomerase n=1 Tax=Klebsiella pneumoniae TaxID=573 RepID=UPI001C04D271|nr:isopentenyl-diphosphate Delta-isomerase [Klebsiella pneumoniae]MBU0049647.1 isopentenyl-diphosphate Delta-isomerase [Klebsiella pneumoniae]MCF1957248.1 isopentenyl-diphosphate Delta-isomerase [Escherichia coli]
MEDAVILVDKNDNELGTMPKLEAHIVGALHRAFSIFIFNSKQQLLIQQRAISKYHSGGLWANTCCSHPLPNELLSDAIHRRLDEELGMQCDMQSIGTILYNEKVTDDLIEHEFDHLFLGFSNELPHSNPDEVMNYRWVSLDTLYQDTEKNPQNYSIWFRYILNRMGIEQFSRWSQGII